MTKCIFFSYTISSIAIDLYAIELNLTCGRGWLISATLLFLWPYGRLALQNELTLSKKTSPLYFHSLHFTFNLIPIDTQLDETTTKKKKKKKKRTTKQQHKNGHKITFFARCLSSSLCCNAANYFFFPESTISV